MGDRAARAVVGEALRAPDRSVQQGQGCRDLFRVLQRRAHVGTQERGIRRVPIEHHLEQIGPRQFAEGAMPPSFNSARHLAEHRSPTTVTEAGEGPRWELSR